MGDPLIRYRPDPHSAEVEAPLSALIDAAFGGASGVVLTRGAAAWGPVPAGSGTVAVDTPAAGAVTVSLATTTTHSITLAASTLITIVNPPSGRHQVATLYLIQGGSGSCVPTFAPTVTWDATGTPVWSTVVGKVDIVLLDWDGTSYRGSVKGLGY